MSILPNVFISNELNVFRPKPYVNLLDELDKNIIYNSLTARIFVIIETVDDVEIEVEVPYTLYIDEYNRWIIYYQGQEKSIKSFIVDDEIAIILTVKKE